MKELLESPVEKMQDLLQKPLTMSREILDLIFAPLQPKPEAEASQPGADDALPGNMHGTWILDRVDGDLDGFLDELGVSYMIKCAATALIGGKFLLFNKENVLVGAYVSSFGNVEMEFPMDGSKTEDLDSNGLPLYFVMMYSWWAPTTS